MLGAIILGGGLAGAALAAELASRVSILILEKEDHRSCPIPWCSFAGVITAIFGQAGSGQAATAGSSTSASSLKAATLSKLM